MRIYRSSRAKRKRFHHKSEFSWFGRFAAAMLVYQTFCTNMASPYKALKSYVKRFGKLLRNGIPQQPETWRSFSSLCKSVIPFHFLGPFIEWFLIFFNGVTVQTSN